MYRPKLEYVDDINWIDYSFRDVMILVDSLKHPLVTILIGSYHRGENTVDGVSYEQSATLVEDIGKEGGKWPSSVSFLTKNLPQSRDLLYQALKGFFYDLSAKQDDGYQQILARFDAAHHKMAAERTVTFRHFFSAATPMRPTYRLLQRLFCPDCYPPIFEKHPGSPDRLVVHLHVP